jgi:replicative DNA helicase
MEHLSEKAFYTNVHREVFKAVKTLYDKSIEIDSRNVMVELKNAGVSDQLVTLKTLVDFKNNTPDLSQFEEFKNRVIELKKQRDLIFLSVEISQKISDKDTDELIKDISDKINDIDKSSSNKDFISDVELSKSFKDGLSLNDYYLKMGEDVSNGREPDMGFKTSFSKLDDIIGGLAKASLTFIGGRTSMGKTTFAINLIANQLQQENPPKILVMSLEMQVSDLKERLLCLFTGVSSKKAKLRRLNRFEADKLISYDKKNPMPNLYWEGTPLSINKLRSKIKRFHERQGVDIVYIDLLSKLKADTQNVNFAREVSEITRGLQDLALELNISIVCLAQLNREVTSRTDKTPQLSDFKNSGSIEEDSDLCILIHRPEYYNAQDKAGITQVHIAKNRLLGERGKVEFIMENGRMKENKIEFLEGGL